MISIIFETRNSDTEPEAAMRRTAFNLAIIAALILANTSLAQPTPFFWDDFDREDLFDSPINYIADDTPEEEYSIQDGSLIVNSLADEFPAIRVDVSDQTRDFVLKTQGRILDSHNCRWAWIGMYGRGSESVSFEVNDAHFPLYWAGYTTSGNVSVGKTIEPEHEDNDLDERGKYSCRQVTENDVHMELQIVGNEITFTTWIDGDQKPDRPDIIWDDETIDENEFVGVFANPNQLEDFALRYFAFLPAVRGDFDGSGSVDVNDIDLLNQARGSGNRVFDLSGDSVIDQIDLNSLVVDTLNTWVGDTDLNGEFNSADLVSVFQADEYEDNIDGNSSWATGDWNGDREFNSADFVTAFLDGGYEQGKRLHTPVVRAIPEPNSCLLIVSGLIMMHCRHRR